MPVTLRIADHDSNEYLWEGCACTPDELLRGSCESEWIKSNGIIQSSFSARSLEQNCVFSASNGFVSASIQAYSHHHHLVIRPEDVWFAILSQLCFFIYANAESLRHLFVSHQGQKKIEVVDSGSIGTADFGKLAVVMGEKLEKHVLDPELREWIMPNFSTTTETDRVVASILMMGSLQKYFTYRTTLICGLPSVTLIGEQADWEDILRRLDKLPSLGPEPERFGTLLKPILRNFIASFDPEPSASVLDFWTKIAHETGGSGPYYLSGWITAFCFWDNDGKLLYVDSIPPVSLEPFECDRAGCDLDGVLYHRVDTDMIPSGFASVPVTVDDNGVIYKTKMVAGSLGILATRSRDRRDGTESGAMGTTVVDAKPDTLQSFSGWLMYEVGEDEVDEVEPPTLLTAGGEKSKGRSNKNQCPAPTRDWKLSGASLPWPSRVRAQVPAPA